MSWSLLQWFLAIGSVGLMLLFAYVTLAYLCSFFDGLD